MPTATPVSDVSVTAEPIPYGQANAALEAAHVLLILPIPFHFECCPRPRLNLAQFRACPAQHLPKEVSRSDRDDLPPQLRCRCIQDGQVWISAHKILSPCLDRRKRHRNIVFVPHQVWVHMDSAFRRIIHDGYHASAQESLESFQLGSKPHLDIVTGLTKSRSRSD